MRSLFLSFLLFLPQASHALDCYYRLVGANADGKTYQKIALAGQNTLSRIRVFVTDSPGATPADMRSFREIPIYDSEHHLRMPAEKLMEPSRAWILSVLAEHKIPRRPNFPHPIEAMKNSHGHWFRDTKKHAYDLDFGYAFKDTIILGRYFIDYYDAGNLVWGATMRWLRFAYLDVKVGSELNEIFGSIRGNRFNWSGDTAADQEAIRLGYDELAPKLFAGLDPGLSISGNLRVIRQKELHSPGRR
jgi:hypothetical protein